MFLMVVSSTSTAILMSLREPRAVPTYTPGVMETLAASARPACCIALLSAVLTAVEVIVAPETASNSPCFSTICAANCSPSSWPMPTVSWLVSTAAAVILPSSTVSSTETAPMPVAVPVTVSACAQAPVSISAASRAALIFFMLFIVSSPSEVHLSMEVLIV